jgi:hypothetical protein
MPYDRFVEKLLKVTLLLEDETRYRPKLRFDAIALPDSVLLFPPLE